MIFRSETLKRCSLPDFKLKWVTLLVVGTYKYLGNYISDDLSDDDDINAMFTVTLQTCKPSRLFISLTLSLSSATLTHFTLFCFGCNLSVFLSPSLSFFPMLTVTFQTYRFSLPAPMLTSFISSLALSLSLSLPSSSLSLSLFSHAHPFYYLLLWTPPPSLSLTPPPFLSLPLSLFSHTHTLYSLLLQIWPLSASSATLTVTLQTRTLPPYLALCLPACLPACLPPSLPPYLPPPPPSLPPSLSFINLR